MNYHEPDLLLVISSKGPGPGPWSRWTVVKGYARYATFFEEKSHFMIPYNTFVGLPPNVEVLFVPTIFVETLTLS